MKPVWCVEHKDGWCAIKLNYKPPEDANNVPTRCNHFVVLPTGFAKRQPTCDECKATKTEPQP